MNFPKLFFFTFYGADVPREISRNINILCKLRYTQTKHVFLIILHKKKLEILVSSGR